MRLSSKARALIMKAYTSNRPIATFSEETEVDLVKSGLMKYGKDKPLLVLTDAGMKWSKRHYNERNY